VQNEDPMHKKADKRSRNVAERLVLFREDGLEPDNPLANEVIDILNPDELPSELNILRQSSLQYQEEIADGRGETSENRGVYLTV
jgi:hypothetical protein